MTSLQSLIPWHRRGTLEIEEAIEAALRNTTDEKEQLDAIAKAHNYFQAPKRLNDVLDAYMSGRVGVEETVSELADPVDKTYTSGDYGRAYWRHEQTARNQRQYHTPGKAAKLWGLEQDFPEPDAEDGDDGSTEMQLWNLWYAVIHAARKVSWKDEIQTARLLDLVKTFKARPDPPLPADITPAMRQDWIYESGTLWSQLILFGPSCREAWNDSPGCGAGYHPLELRAWRNLNAFVARSCAEQVVSFWSFCLWATSEMCEAHKRGNKQNKTPLRVRLEAWTPAAAAWIHAAGHHIFLAVTDREDGFADISSTALGQEGFTREAWTCWKKQFVLLAREGSRVDVHTRQIAREAAQRMEEIEAEVGGAK